MLNSIQDNPGFLRCGAIIQINQWLPVYPGLQDRKIIPDGMYIVLCQYPELYKPSSTKRSTCVRTASLLNRLVTSKAKACTSNTRACSSPIPLERR